MTTPGTLRQEESSSLQDMAARIQQQQETKFDWVVDTRNMSFLSTTDGSRLLFDDGDMVSGGLVNDHAHSQIAARLQVPRSYYDRMRSDAPELLDRNVQHWLHTSEDRRMVRMLGGNVRAFLSDRYRRLDNIDLVEQAIIPAFSHFHGDLRFQLSALTDERLYVRALLPTLQAEVGVGDIVQAGVEIRNSEVGSGSLSVSPFIFRLVCKNGMVVADRTLRRYHIGRQQEETAYAIYQDDTLAADDTAIFLKVRDSIKAALSNVTFDLIVQDIVEARTSIRVASPVVATERLAAKHSLSQGEQGSLLAFLASGGDMSRWGMVNAVTATAKGADTFRRQQELEALGGTLLVSPREDWAAICAA